MNFILDTDTTSNLHSHDDTATDSNTLRVPCDVYSRIVGYMTPVRNWNTGKRQEFAERVVYAIPEAAVDQPDLA